VGEAVEVWRGSVAAGECDSQGHLNVGFFDTKAMEALVGLAAELGMPRAFAAHAESTLIVAEQHIRFQREARVDARLSIEAGVLELGEEDARVLLLMRHAGGELAASFQMRVLHATARERRPFPWPARVRERAEALKIEPPEHARPRGLTLAPIDAAAALARAQAAGIPRAGLSAIGPADCDAFGRMRADVAVARITAGATHLFGDILSRAPRAQAGRVVLEYRLAHLDWPRVGDRVDLRSGLTGAEPRIQRLVHWLLDPTSGRPWVAAEAATAAFDPETRKMVVLDDAELAAWQAMARPETSL
jgi:acyl-CoA thioester hydrolase